MTTPEDDLPDWIASKIGEPNNRNDLTKRPVALELYHGERPYYSVTQMQAELDSDHSEDTVRDRLDDLTELDIADTDQVNNGKIYYLDDPDSEWPVPTDVDVEPERTEPTVSEFFGRGSVKMAALGVAVTVVSGLVILLGAYEAANRIALPVSGTNLLATGLAAIIFSWVLFIWAGLLWVLNFEGEGWLN